MEEKLFWIGLITLAFSFALREALKDKHRHKKSWTMVLHSIFCGGSAFALALIVFMSLENKEDLRNSPGAITPRTLYPSLFGLAAGLLWGAYSAYKNGNKEEDRRETITEDLEWADTISSAVLLASFLMFFILQAFKIPSGSMHNTLFEGDHLFVNKFLFGVRIPMTDKRLLRIRPVQRGDIIVFEFPSRDPNELHCGSPQAGKDFIKRAVAVSGDVVQVKNGVVFVNGQHPQEDYALYTDAERLPAPANIPPQAHYQELWQSRRLDAEVGDLIRDNFGPVTVPEGSYFAMGDNRDRSCDSRFWGPVPDRFLKGKAWFLYWPPSRMRAID